MKLVEVRIDLENYNEKIIINYFDITKETDKHYIAEVDEWNRKTRRFLKGTLNKVLYGGKINLYYRFVTDLEDYRAVENSLLTKRAVDAIYDRHKYILDYWQRTLENRKVRYYKDCNLETCQ